MSQKKENNQWNCIINESKNLKTQNERMIT